MKNRLAIIAFALVMVSAPVIAHAQVKIGVININGAIADTQEGKKTIADLQRKYQPRQEELQRLQQEIQSLQEQANKPNLSDDDQRRIARDLEDKQRELKRSTDDAQADFTADRDDAIRRIGQKMVKIINDYATKNGLTLVIDGAQVPIYYAAKGVDLGPEMVKLYDAANPVAGGVTPSAAKPAAPGSPAKPK